jgi:magnesium-protoporphyrin IX monomethyl ester (oxidative) cyclase
MYRIQMGIEESHDQGFMGTLRRVGLYARAGAVFARLYLLPVKKNDLPDSSRLEPVW